MTKTASLTDFRSVLPILSQVQPDAIYNLDGQRSVDLSFRSLCYSKNHGCSHATKNNFKLKIY